MFKVQSFNSKKEIMKRTFFLTCTFLFINLCFSANYYAAPNATGSGTSIDNPCSFTAGIAKSDLDTLFLRGGQYNLTATQNFNATGTATKRKAMVAYGNEKPILDFRNQAYGSRGVQFGGNYQYVRGITICYTGKNGFYVTGSYSIFENCETYGNGDTGFQNKNCCGNLIKNCDSHHNFDYQSGSLTSPNFGGNADGFADKQYVNNGAPNVYEGCRSWANSDDGWDFYDKTGSSIIRNSICFNIGPSSYDMRNHPRLNVDKSWFDQFPTTINDNYITLENYRNYGNRNGYKLGGLNSVHDVEVTNCLAVACAGKGFDQNNNFGTMTLYNNSSYNNGRNYGFSNGNGGTLIIRNSLSLNTNGGQSNSFSTKTYTHSHNSWDISGLTCTVADFASLDTSLVISPRLPNGDLPVTPFMRLVEGSKLIDAGTNVGLPYAGKAPDLGCFEFGEITGFTETSKKPVSLLKNNIASDFIGLNSIDKISSVQIFSITGQLCLSLKLAAKEIDVSMLNSGYYIVKILKENNEILTEKFLKK